MRDTDVKTYEFLASSICTEFMTRENTSWFGSGEEVPFDQLFDIDVNEGEALFTVPSLSVLAAGEAELVRGSGAGTTDSRDCLLVTSEESSDDLEAVERERVLAADCSSGGGLV